MALPDPLPDNPLRWEGWRNYNSDNPYLRLCLDFDANPTSEQIEENCRCLLVWWQKKLPLKNQPSNPISQLLRMGMDEAPGRLAEARTRLLDPAERKTVDADLRSRMVEAAIDDFRKILPFAIFENELTTDAEQRLYHTGGKSGLAVEDMQRAVDEELERLGAVRVANLPPPPPPPPVPVATAVQAYEPGDPATEFRRVLKMSRLCLDGEEMTDDQRDALCNMGESLGLTGGEAEDLIDEYLEIAAAGPQQTEPSPRGIRAGGAAAKAPDPMAARAAAAMAMNSMRPVSPAAAPKPIKLVSPQIVNTSPVARVQERAKFPNFVNFVGGEMFLVPSGIFFMGSNLRDATPHEQPVTQTTVSCFYIARFPITNAQFERFDPAHRAKRAPWANDHHPVVYVSAREAMAFCQWLSARDGKKYRLPTEAEWEYAARGTDSRQFPWGERLDAGHFANFADKRTHFAWRDVNIDDGFAETAPIGSYPRGASPFGVEDMAGNVFEWCLDFFDPYRGRAMVNPRGPTAGQKRVCRGGSWKSRASTLRTSARAFNTSDYLSNDVGFRVICECEG